MDLVACAVFSRAGLWAGRGRGWRPFSMLGRRIKKASATSHFLIYKTTREPTNWLHEHPGRPRLHAPPSSLERWSGRRARALAQVFLVPAPSSLRGSSSLCQKCACGSRSYWRSRRLTWEDKEGGNWGLAGRRRGTVNAGGAATRVGGRIEGLLRMQSLYPLSGGCRLQEVGCAKG